jgi:hypothetical protein
MISAKAVASVQMNVTLKQSSWSERRQGKNDDYDGYR